MKIFSTAALLCAVSFTPSQASDCGNPYGINQERESSTRCIRVITEIPVGMLDSDVSHHGRCEHAILPSASESCPSKKAGSQSLVENLLRELAKNLKVTPPVVDPENGATFGFGGVGVAEANAARAAKDAKAAYDAVIKAEKAAVEAGKYITNTAPTGPEAAKAREYRERLIATREGEARKAREKADFLMDGAMDAVTNANTEAAKSFQPLVYDVNTPIWVSPANTRAMENRFAGLTPKEKINKLNVAVQDAIYKDAANSFSTHIAMANSVINALRMTGATLEDVSSYLFGLRYTLPLPSTVNVSEVLRIASRAVPVPIY